MKFLSLALLSLTALVGAQSVSSVVNGLDALTQSFSTFSLGGGDSSFSSAVDGLASEIQDFTHSITSVGQKRGYPVSRNVSARTTFSDADAAQVVDAFASFASAEEKVLTVIAAEQAAIALAGQAQPMHDSVVKLQQANEALSTAVVEMLSLTQTVQALLDLVQQILLLLFPLIDIQ